MKRTLLIVAAIILVAALLLFAFGKLGCNSSKCGEKKMKTNRRCNFSKHRLSKKPLMANR